MKLGQMILSRGVRTPGFNYILNGVTLTLCFNMFYIIISEIERKHKIVVTCIANLKCVESLLDQFVTNA